jgi:PKD repeat protein
MPQANFEDVTGCPGFPQQFTDQTNANGGTITSWTWTFGDPNSGTLNTSYEQNPTHTFNDPGTYPVSLEVKTNGVCTDIRLKDIVINTTPAAAVKPQGDVTICKDIAGKTYITEGASGASAYNWLTVPETAGTISGTGTTGTLSLTSGFTGSFSVQVQGVNACGNGIFSQELPVTVIETPASPARPSGIDSVNLNKTLLSEFAITAVPGALSYAWSILPSNAGTATGNGLTGSVAWDKTYRGNATLTAKAVNACGESLSSDDKIVKIYAPVGMAENDGFAIEVFPNPNNGKFSLDITSATVSTASLSIFNTLGAVVFAENDLVINGKLHKIIDISSLPKGVYRIKLEGNGISKTISIVIAK